MSSAVESPVVAQPPLALQPEAGVPPQPAAEAKQQGLEEDLKASLKVRSGRACQALVGRGMLA